MSGRAACLIAMFALAAVPATAQVDPSGEWRTLHTTHFRIHFRPSFVAVAHRAANEAERAWALLASELPPPRGIVDITLSDDMDAANGFASQVPSNRITILLTSGAGEMALQRFDSWLRGVLVHELAHVFHLDRTHRWWSVLQSIFGRAPGLFPNGYQPSWMVEGLATYYESRFTGGGRVEGDVHAQVLAAQYADGPHRTPWNAVFYTSWPAGFAPYAYGGEFVDSAQGLAADSLVAQYVSTTARQLIPWRVGRPYRLTTGRDLQSDWDSVMCVLPAPSTADAAPAAPAVLARGLRSPALAQISGDRRLVAYHHDDGKSAPELRIMSLDDWRIVRRHRVNSNVTFDWLGDTLVVAQLDYTGRRVIRSDLYSWLPDGRWRRDTRARRMTAPRAGGGVLATIGLTHGGHQPFVNGVPRTDTAGTSWGALVPSRDGRWVAGSRHRDGHWSLVRWPIDQPDSVTVLVSSREVISDPVWDDAGTLYFVMPAAGLPQVHEWTDSGPVVRTAVPLGARNGVPLGDGVFLYSTLAGDGWQLHRGATGPARPVTAAPTVPFDSAPAVATRETEYASWPSARPHYWLPSYLDAGAAGQFLGFSTSGTDAVGRMSYFVSGLASADPLRGLGSVRLVSEALGSPSLDIGVSNDWSLLSVTSGGTAISEHTVDASVGATFVARRWRTSAALRLALEGERFQYAAEPTAPIDSVCPGCMPRDFLGGSVSLRLAHFVSAPLAVSQQDGFVWTVSYRRREQLMSTDWSGEAQSRLAAYLALPIVGYARPVLAFRVAGGVTHGPSPLSFGVGGVSSGVLDLGFGFRVGTSRSFPVRGYEPSDLRGSRALTATAELRLPVLLLGRSLGHLPVGADQISLALFADAGDAWNGSDGPHLSRMVGVGGELVADLRVNYDLPLRARLGVAYPVGLQEVLDAKMRERQITVYVGFGADF